MPNTLFCRINGAFCINLWSKLCFRVEYRSKLDDFKLRRRFCLLSDSSTTCIDFGMISRCQIHYFAESTELFSSTYGRNCVFESNIDQNSTISSYDDASVYSRIHRRPALTLVMISRCQIHYFAESTELFSSTYGRNCVFESNIDQNSTISSYDDASVYSRIHRQPKYNQQFV
jgi:ABC-type iron transport system FetAB ATPase subunit